MPVKSVKKSPSKIASSKPRVPKKKPGPKKHVSGEPKPLKKLPDMTLTDMPLFHRLTNWEEMWRDFNLSLNPEGRAKYKTLKGFVGAVKESEEQGDFLLWFLGSPSEEDQYRNEKYAFAGKPLDFYKRRETGGWFTEEALKLISKNVLHGTNALEQIQAAGNGSALHQIYRIEKLKQELDRSFQGSFDAEGLSMKDAAERMSLYLSLHGRLDGLSRSAIEQFALTRGINFADMSGYAALLQGMSISIANFNGIGGGPVQAQKSNVEKCISDMVKLTMAKSKLFDTPVPPSLEPDNVIDVTPEEEHHKKKKPN